MLDKAMLRKTIALRLKQAREKAGYFSAEDFCEKNKLPLTCYLDYEKGNVAIKTSQAERYCKLLNVSLQWLMLDDNQSKVLLKKERKKNVCKS